MKNISFKQFINQLKEKGITNKEYESLEELVNDAENDTYKNNYSHISSFIEDQDHITNQNTPYLSIYSKDISVLKQVSELGESVLLEPDKEVFITPLLDTPPYERAISFKDNYNLKENEEFHIELDCDNSIYEFIKERLLPFCKENSIELRVESPNDNGVESRFVINTKGEIISNVKVKNSLSSIENYLYLAYTLLKMNGSTNNLLECNPIFE